MYRTDEEINELAKVGLYPDEHEEYKRRVEQLKEERQLSIQNHFAPDLVGRWEGGLKLEKIE